MSDHDIVQLVTNWHEAKQHLNAAVAKERELRRQLFDKVFPDPKIGVNRYSIGHGKDLVGTHKMNYKIDLPVFLNLRDEIPAEVIDDVINFRPEVRPAELLKLDGEVRDMFSQFVSQSPASPTLEIKDEKKRGRK